MSLNLEYFLLVFFASLGVLQIAAARSELKGLSFFPCKLAAYIFSLLIIGGAFGWFFGWDNRLGEKILRPGLEGGGQTLYFLLGFLAALAFTLIVSSLLKWRSLPQPGEQGLEALRERGYLQALRGSFRRRKG